ncbi:hypothetical protein BCR34DRAFT_564452 [Clohesyomyces aquaticus]|uniref:Uncharacterized protein n=1 Tax=Clohesyomyces aquaticus TaxID=1231657 RepID=A0A1Y1ZQF8_9PLEO|nr:hypothetical protein BCR34DRAFT_564452 [Clohesyomyces aquaticus]
MDSMYACLQPNRTRAWAYLFQRIDRASKHVRVPYDDHAISLHPHILPTPVCISYHVLPVLHQQH